MPKENHSTQRARFIVEVFLKPKERENEQSESGLSVSSEEIAIKLQKMSENGQRKKQIKCK